MASNSYFSHDSNARNTDRIIPLRIKHGAEGYGVYFMILERLRDEPDYTSVKDYNMLAFDLRVSSGIIKSVIEDFGLFSFTDNGERFYSGGFLKRMSIKDEKSEKAKKSALKRWEKEKNDAFASKNDANAMRTHIKNDAIKESKGKESKGKEKKGNENEGMDYPPPKNEIEIDFDFVLELFNSTCPSLPKISKLADARKKKVSRRLTEMENDVEKLKTVFEKAEKSDFMRGDNKNGWRATFDWIFENETNWVKIIEGNYDNKKNNQKNDTNRRILVPQGDYGESTIQL